MVDFRSGLGAVLRQQRANEQVAKANAVRFQEKVQRDNVLSQIGLMNAQTSAAAQRASALHMTNADQLSATKDARVVQDRKLVQDKAFASQIVDGVSSLVAQGVPFAQAGQQVTRTIGLLGGDVGRAQKFFSQPDAQDRFQSLNGLMTHARDLKDPVKKVVHVNQNGRSVLALVKASGRVVIPEQASGTQPTGQGRAVVPQGGSTAPSAPQPFTVPPDSKDTANNIKFISAVGKRVKDLVTQETAKGKRANLLQEQVDASSTVLKDIALVRDIMKGRSEFDPTKEDTFAHAATRVIASHTLSAGTRDLAGLIESIKSNVGIDSLLKIKQAGSGLGQVPQSQLETLESLLGKLDLSQSPKQFHTILLRINEIYISAKARAEKEQTSIAESLLGTQSRIEQLNAILKTKVDAAAGSPPAQGKVRVYNPATGKLE